MGSLYKYLKVFLLWTAGLAFCGHLIIIHDHHSSMACSEQEDSCPVSTGHSDHDAGFPIHCHAFNDVAAEKAVPFQFGLKVPCNNTLICYIAENPVFGAIPVFIRIPDPIHSFPDTMPLDSSSLRAPPSFS